MIKYKLEKVIEVKDWDILVQETYGKPYCFQQQDGCQSRGYVGLDVKKELQTEWYDFKRNEIPTKVNGEIMGVSFKTWLEANEDNFDFDYDFEDELFWERNFYPNIDMVANDLCKKGLIEEGSYLINIDW